jgi:hypothetical protein
LIDIDRHDIGRVKMNLQGKARKEEEITINIRRKNTTTEKFHNIKHRNTEMKR